MGNAAPAIDRSTASPTVDELHESVIWLWIKSKIADPDRNPASAIFSALTMRPWPAGTPEVSNAIELCDAVSRASGHPPLSEPQRRRLHLKAIALYEEFRASRTPGVLAGFIPWAHRLGLVLAAASLVVGGISGWVIVLAFAAWSCYGAAQMAARMRRAESRPAWEVPAIAAMHLAALTALCAVSTLHLVNHR